MRWPAALAGPILMTLIASSAAASPRLIWSDEFEGAGLDAAKWSADVDCWGGGNHERQCYTGRPENVAVIDGQLRITARRERMTGPALPARLGGGGRKTQPYTSARISTRGKASFLYGRIAVRAKLPAGQGLWPAIWLLPEHDNYGPYPLSGEIDIAEAVNLGVRCRGCRDEVHAALHHGRSLAATRHWTGRTRLPDVDAFHVFALDWTPERMTWWVDGRPYFEQPTRPPFDQRFHLILNLAVGGRWPEGGGRKGIEDGALPATMLVDWVRVYALD